jgi:hypothetical protein
VNDNDRLKETEPAWQKLLGPPPLTPQEQADKARRDRGFQPYIERVVEIYKCLDEPDRTILDLFLQSLTHRQIGDRINRSHACVTERLGKINALVNSQVHEADRAYFLAALQMACCMQKRALRAAKLSIFDWLQMPPSEV